jgi:hypothetical protein
MAPDADRRAARGSEARASHDLAPGAADISAARPADAPGAPVTAASEARHTDPGAVGSWLTGLAWPAWLARRLGWCLAAMVIVLDLAIVAPLLGHGTLQLLDFGDYPVGPHPPFAPSAYGFPPGITNRAPVEAVLYWFFQGIPWPPLRLLPFVAVAPLACASFARIFPGRWLAISVATVLFTVNPFVYERMANGQVYVVLGYALLPVLLALAVRPLASLVAAVALGGLVFAVDAAVSVHYLFIGGLLLLTVAVAHLACRRAKEVLASAGSAACGMVLSLYWLIPAARAVRTMRPPVTGLDLAVFQTLGDRVWGLAVNIAGLYGFWRPGPPLVKNYLSGWPFLLLAILTVAGFGLHGLWARGGGAGRPLAFSCAVLGIAGALLAAGTQGPAGGIYAWLFAHLPGFKVMREPGKFSALLALAYACCFGAGAEAVVRPLARNATRIACVCCLAAVPLLYGCTEFWGFAGYARPAEYPTSWAAADRAMSPGAEALALPWLAYLRVPWMGDRVVADPMQGYFDRPVISADNLEAGPIVTETSDPRSLFLQFCVDQGNRLTEFGRILAPLGIRYVILAKVPGSQSFAWLSRQRDLRRVFGSAEIVIYRNEEPVRVAYQPTRHLVLQDWGQVAALAQRLPLVDYLIRVRHARSGPLTLPATVAIPSAQPPAPLRTVGGTPVTQPVGVGPVARTVVLTNPAYSGWRLAGFRSTTQFGVAVAFTRPAGTGRRGIRAAVYEPWRLVRACDVTGACLLAGDLALLAAVLIRRRDTR